jgi:hypothetical protein
MRSGCLELGRGSHRFQARRRIDRSDARSDDTYQPITTADSMGTLQNFSTRHPIWTLVVLVLVIALAWIIVAPWPPGLEQVMGRKRVFLNAILSGVTLGALYFLVASGFTLVFGLMRNVNLAHGSLYLLGGYIGYGVVDATGYWLLAFPVVFIIVGALGLLLQHQKANDPYGCMRSMFASMARPMRHASQNRAVRRFVSFHKRHAHKPRVAGNNTMSQLYSRATLAMP